MRIGLPHDECPQVAQTCLQRGLHVVDNLEGQWTLSQIITSSLYWARIRLNFFPLVVQITSIQPGIASPFQVPGTQPSVQEHM